MIGVEDERAIAAILLRYATAIDRRDWALLRSCFTDDFEGDYAAFGRWRSAEAITSFMAQAHAGLGPTLHRLTNLVIEGDAAAASARSYVDALLMPATPEGETHRAAGWYEDNLLHTADGWKIARRRFVPVLIS
jgi:ketosteroid isomerase-like protein